jgi:hypothetical protein
MLRSQLRPEGTHVLRHYKGGLAWDADSLALLYAKARAAGAISVVEKGLLLRVCLYNEVPSQHRRSLRARTRKFHYHETRLVFYCTTVPYGMLTI